jgi:hypothetical protein
MSEPITFSGDDLARRVPLLGQFREDLVSTITPLTDIAACRWANHATSDDEMTTQARGGVHGVLVKYILPSYVSLGGSVGVQGDKLDIVRQVGDSTEGTNNEVAGGWPGGGGTGVHV